MYLLKLNLLLQNQLPKIPPPSCSKILLFLMSTETIVDYSSVRANSNISILVFAPHFLFQCLIFCIFIESTNEKGWIMTIEIILSCQKSKVYETFFQFQTLAKINLLQVWKTSQGSATITLTSLDDQTLLTQAQMNKDIYNWCSQQAKLSIALPNKQKHKNNNIHLVQDAPSKKQPLKLYEK